MHSDHFHLIKFVLNKELGELYATIALRSLALSMTGIFVPLYLLIELGYSLNKVLLFFIIAFFVWMIFIPISAKIISKIGAKHTLLFSMVVFVIFYFMLLLLDTNPILFYYTAAMIGVSSPLFWIAFHLDFIKSSDRDHRGEEISIYHFLALVMTLIGPLIGALILTYYNFNILFIVVGIIMFLSAFPLFLSKEVYEKSKFNLLEVFSKQHFRESFAFIGHGMMISSLKILWPIFIFFILGSYLSLGFLASVVSVFNALFIITVGRYSDVVDKRNILKLGAVFGSAVWFIKAFSTTVIQVFTISSIGGIIYSMINVPLQGIVYDRSEKDIGYIVFSEMMLAFGKLLVLLVVLLTGSLIVGFLSTALASLFILLI